MLPMTRKSKFQPLLLLHLLGQLIGQRMMKASYPTFPSSRLAEARRLSLPQPLLLSRRLNLDNKMMASSKLVLADADVVARTDTTTMDTVDLMERGVDVGADEACAADSVAVNVDPVANAASVDRVANVASVDRVVNVANAARGEVPDLIAHKERGESGMEKAVRGGSGMVRGGNTTAKGEDVVDVDAVASVDHRVALHQHQRRRRQLQLHKRWVGVCA